MNCFEVRKEFVAFWRRQMPPLERAAFSQHLGTCPRCDGSFRLFALSAPVLHSGTEPESGGARAHRSGGLHVVAAPAHRDGSAPASRGGKLDRLFSWRDAGAVIAVAAAASLALYFASPTPRPAFEDAVTGPNSASELATYTSPTSLFGQEILGSDSTLQDSLSPESGLQDDLAG
jgi:hypothetical protein